jgi:acyl-CoA:acyl-CoA alkyltransferase
MMLLDNMHVVRRPRSRIRGVGVHLPERVVDNAEISSLVVCPDEELKQSLPRFIESLTGIHTRRWADADQSPSLLAARAAEAALDIAGLAGSDIDTLIFAATDLDQIEPATANVVQDRLGLGAVNSFDVKCACNSVLQAMFVMDSLIASGACRKGLVVCGEMGSHWVNLEVRDRQDLAFKLGGLTLGDGGAAIVMEPSDDERGMLEFNLSSLPASWQFCHVPHDVDWRARPDRSIMGWFYLDLASLAQMVQTHVPAYCRQYADYRGRQHGEANFADSMHHLIPHQISERLIRMLCTETKIPMERTAVTADRYGNTAAASIPIAMGEAIGAGRIAYGSGQEIILFGAASGFSIGHVRVRM